MPRCATTRASPPLFRFASSIPGRRSRSSASAPGPICARGSREPLRGIAHKPKMKPEVLVLCGGEGTRLRPVVGDRPKGLADIAGRAFLDILVDELLAQGFRRVVLCTGYGAEQI